MSVEVCEGRSVILDLFFVGISDLCCFLYCFSFICHLVCSLQDLAADLLVVPHKLEVGLEVSQFGGQPEDRGEEEEEEEEEEKTKEERGKEIPEREESESDATGLKGLSPLFGKRCGKPRNTAMTPIGRHTAATTF